MKRILTIVLTLLGIVSAAFGQSDSAAFAGGKWTESKVAKGITLRQCHFAEKELFGANEYICVLLISPSKALDVVESARGTLARTTELATANNATVAVNGSFFFMKAPYGPTNYVRINGRYAGNTKSGGSSRLRGRSEDGCLVLKGRRASVIKGEGDITWEDSIKAEDILAAGPMLLENGCRSIVADTGFNSKRHPRTAIGIRKDGTRILVTVDGRTPDSQGASIPEMQEIMHWLGCVDALNLDGGGSTTMVVNGSIVNHPCDNKAFDDAGERPVANAVIVR